MNKTETHVIAAGNALEYWHLPENDAHVELMIIRPYKEKTPIDYRIERREAAEQAGNVALKTCSHLSLAPLPDLLRK